VQELDIPAEHLHCAPMVAQGPVALAQGGIRGDLQVDIPQGRGDSQRTLGGRQTPVQVAQLPQGGGYKASDLS
jgi:hypothetical protein